VSETQSAPKILAHQWRMIAIIVRKRSQAFKPGFYNIFMSFLDNLESNLKSLESGQEGKDDVIRDQKDRANNKAWALASAPYADALKNGGFTQDLLAHATRIAFGKRIKVQPTWLGSTLRLQAREQRLELRPTPEGVVAFFYEDNEEQRREPVDLNGSAEDMATRWLDA
jgi:hypothetical protein